ncbi:MAG TPA: nitroreductase family protein [Anaerovoracaceae bacterium]|nr:nitroreductase family protein [Anaerovoracaceae bacterium]
MEKGILDIINDRASCRSFSDKEIPSDLLKQILEAAVKAPSGGGFQNYSIIKVTDREKKEQLVKYGRNQKFIARAPVSLVFCIDYRRMKRINEAEPAPFAETERFTNFWMSVVDTAVCAQTACLAAEALGLKSVYIGNILNVSDQVSELLKLPDYVLPSIMVTLGYPLRSPKRSQKYDAELLVHEEEYHDAEIDQLLSEYRKKYSDWHMKPNGKNTGTIYKTAAAYHGQDYAELCKKNILERNSVSPYQYWFGCYYLEEKGFMGFPEFQAFMEKKGFHWTK